MTKKKEIEVWVSPEEMKNGDYFYAHKRGYDGPIRGDSIKATLTYTLPERKIELTEGEFWKALSESYVNNKFNNVPVTVIDGNVLKQKLFGSDHE